MKTIEEKAKDYDEALKRARKILNEILDNEILGFPDQIREIFPELRGSEDERIRNGIQLVLESWDRSHVSSVGLPSLVPKYISWLKSLRPSWKPNDNQMSMLRAIVNDPNNVGAESCRLAMQSLYNDLLKLNNHDKRRTFGQDKGRD